MSLCRTAGIRKLQNELWWPQMHQFFSFTPKIIQAMIIYTVNKIFCIFLIQKQGNWSTSFTEIVKGIEVRDFSFSEYSCQNLTMRWSLIGHLVFSLAMYVSLTSHILFKYFSKQNILQPSFYPAIHQTFPPFLGWSFFIYNLWYLQRFFNSRRFCPLLPWVIV